LAPGEYALHAWEAVDPNAAMSPEYRSKFSAYQKTVRLLKGGRDVVLLKQIGAGAVRREDSKGW
jgi:hypothetical protein